MLRVVLYPPASIRSASPERMGALPVLLTLIAVGQVDARPRTGLAALVCAASLATLVSAEEYTPVTAEDVLQKYKNMLPRKDVKEEPLPNHKGNPVWLHQKVRVIREVHHVKGLSGHIGYARDFEEKTGRYLVDFETSIEGRTEFALHPVNLEPAEPKSKKAKKDEL